MDGMETRHVSVILPTHNRLALLKKALASVERQEYKSYSVVLIVDGSSDGTVEFAREESLREHFPGIPAFEIIVNEQPRGAAASRNLGMARSRGDFIAFLDDDDTWAPHYLGHVVGFLGKHPGASACYAAHLQEGEHGEMSLADTRPLFEHAHPLVELLTESPIHSMSVFSCRRSVFETLGGMDESTSVVHDWEWYARIVLSGGEILPCGEEPLVRRAGPGGLVTAHRDWYAEEREVIDGVAAREEAVAHARRHILAYRSLFFARLALRRGDHSFALARLAESLWRAPLYSVRVAHHRLRRNRQLAKRATLKTEQ